MNKEILTLWILDKCRKMENKLATTDTVEEALMHKGQLEILQELFTDFNLETVDTNEMTYHSGI